MASKGEQFADFANQCMNIFAKFQKARAGRCPYSAKGNCPSCQKGMVHFKYNGPRAIRMQCDNAECGIKMLA